jgi:hypothetical protein
MKPFKLWPFFMLQIQIGDKKMCFWNAIFVYILLSMFVMAPSRDKSIMRGQLIRFKRVRRSKVIFSNRNRSTRFSVCTQSNPTGCSPLTTWYGRESRPPLPSCRQNWEKTWQITVHPVPSIQQNQPKVPKVSTCEIKSSSFARKMPGCCKN